MTFIIRDYQSHAHELIVDGFKKGLKLLMLQPTGTGKSKTAVSFIEKYQAHYNFVLVVRKRDLVLQLEKDLQLFNLDYGVFMAGHERYFPTKSIQVCSIDTLDSRETYPHVNDARDCVLIIDEADETNADGYQELIKRYTRRHLLKLPVNFTVAEITKIRPAFLVGMTATAFDTGLPHFDAVIIPITPKEALRRGYLVDFVYYIPSVVDLSGIRIEKGEFNNKDVDLKFNSPTIIKQCFEKWLRWGDNRQTLVFCSSKNHAENFAKYINDFYGQIIAISVDADTPSDERKIIYNDFANGKLKFLVNIRLITRGVDIPEIGTILDCAPTASINNHIQKLGRGSRPNPFYKDCIVIDCANNCVRNGEFYEDRKVDLQKIKKKRNLSDLLMRVCPNCFRGYAVDNYTVKCPYCNTYTGKVKISDAKQKKLEMESATPEKILQIKMINSFKKRLWTYQNLGRKYSKDIAREKAIHDLIAEYGMDKVKTIKGVLW